MRERDSFFPLVGIYLLQKQLPLSGKLLSFSTLVLPKQFCRFIFENVAPRHSLNAALRQRFLWCGIFANQRIRRTFFFCTRRIALHAHQAILCSPGDTSNPSENDIPALASKNPSRTNARRMATIPRSIGRETAHGSFDSTSSATPAKIH